MGHAQLMELEFESNLCAELSERGWLYDAGGFRPRLHPGFG